MSFTEEISALLRQAYKTKKWELILEVIQRLDDISFEDDAETMFDGDVANRWSESEPKDEEIE